MLKGDIAQVSQIDHEAFPTMWPPVNFNNELNNRLAHYVVVRDGARNNQDSTIAGKTNRRPGGIFKLLRWIGVNPATIPADTYIEADIFGFLGLWLMVDEAHIINVAVKENYRRKGIGELLIISSIDLALLLHATMLTLEVRVSNTPAQNLYTKYGFDQVGLRRNYYTDNKEDAILMSTDNVNSEEFQSRFRKLKEAHFKKLGDILYRVV
jgi:[ribosomal protein S18]-alanine N-acetyltransferase